MYKASDTSGDSPAFIRRRAYNNIFLPLYHREEQMALSGIVIYDILLNKLLVYNINNEKTRIISLMYFFRWMKPKQTRIVAARSS